MSHFLFFFHYFHVYPLFFCKTLSYFLENYYLCISLFFYIIITHKKENYEKDCIDGAVFAVASMAASAQIYVGGSLGIGSSKANSNADNQTNFSIKPEVG